MKAILLALTSLFAAIPGLAVLISDEGIVTPPTYRVLFGSLAETLGVLALLILFVNRERLQRASKSAINTLTIVCAVAALVCLVAYMVLFPLCVVTSTTVAAWGDHPVYFPLWLNGEVSAIVHDSGGRQAAVDEFGPGAIQNILNKMPGRTTAYAVTTNVLLLCFLGFFTLITLSFGIPGFHASDDIDGSEPKPDANVSESQADEPSITINT